MALTNSRSFASLRMTNLSKGKIRVRSTRRSWRLGGDLRLFQLLESCAYFVAGALFFFAIDFEQQRRFLRCGTQQFHGLFPVDRSVAWPEVRVFVFVVIVDVGRADVTLQN